MTESNNTNIIPAESINIVPAESLNIPLLVSCLELFENSLMIVYKPGTVVLS